ncbi:MAG: hypothetical protein IT547_02375 [Hyphomonadaceae bacterium]|nr:hypothetical protein [Hyphomonadaceae bacterium]
MSKPLTLKQAIDDLGWFWGVFTSLVNAPSILVLLQMVFEHRYIDALQWIVDGYNDIANQIGAALEPVLGPLIAQLNGLFGWTIELQPHWRPLLLLALIPATSIARQVWRPKSGGDIIEPLAVGLGAVVGVVVAGVIPLDDRWWDQGLVAALPIGVILLFSEAAVHLGNLFEKPINREPFGPFYIMPYVLLFCSVALLLGAGLSFVAPLHDGSGLLALGAMIMVLGSLSLLSGLSEGEPTTARMGLTMLGAFVVAGAILAADAILKILN